MSEEKTKTTPRFSGNHEVSIDPKMRLPIPAAFREVLSDGYPDCSDRVFVTVDDDAAIAVFPLPIYNAKIAQLEDVAVYDESAENLAYLMETMGRECALDKQGRIRLSEELMQYADLERAAIVSGSGRTMKIQECARFRAKRDQLLGRIGDMKRSVKNALREAKMAESSK